MNLRYVLVLVCGLSSVASLTACGAPETSTSNGQALVALPNCARLYSGQPKDPTTAGTLKAIDSSLDQHREAVARLVDSLDSFQKICARIIKTNCRDCPDIEAFSDAHGRFEMRANAIERLEKSIKAFEPALLKIKAVEFDSACYDQIVDRLAKSEQTKKELYVRFNETKCVVR